MHYAQYEQDFDPLLDPDHVRDTSRSLLAECPVAHSDKGGGFWILNRYRDVSDAFKDASVFAVGREDGRGSLRVPPDPPGIGRPLYPPIDLNPPLHRDFRLLLNPYFTPAALAQHEPGFRSVIAGLLDQAIANNPCDIAESFTKIFPAHITFKELFQIPDEAEVSEVSGWVRSLTYDIFKAEPEHLGALQEAFSTWTRDLIHRRIRRPAKKRNVIDALVHGQVDGRPLDESELVATIQILILGGFSTTADGSCNMVEILATEAGMEGRLREDPELRPNFVEEVLRLDPPLSTRPRRCLADVDIEGARLARGERVLLNITAANRDPEEFPQPDSVDLARSRNRHLSFGAGVHRCIGSSMARQVLSIVLDETLARIRDIRIPAGQKIQRVSYSSGVWRAVDHLPIEFRAVEDGSTEPASRVRSTKH